MFPPEFEKSVAGDNASGRFGHAELLEALNGEPVVSLRYNPYKLSSMPLVGDPVPWNRYGAYLAERPVFTLDPAMHAGAYYVQEASSQFVEHIYRQAVGQAHDDPSVFVKSAQMQGSRRAETGAYCGVCEDFGEEHNAADAYFSRKLPEGIRILDLCAAPGGKTTLYSTLAGPSGLVVANEVIRQRAGVLADNVRRWGIGNVAVSCNEPKDFSAYRHWFDVLAIDAPCSGEGMFRKNPYARAEWSLANVELCAARQRKILADAWDALRPGGILIYSTCTFNRRENEDNVAWLAENFAVESVEVEVPKDWRIECGEVGGIRTFRFLPHKVRGEGFFAAVMRKDDGRIKREIPRAKREPLTELNRTESRPLTEWMTTPDAMKFARAGNNCHAFYRPQYQTIAALATGLNIIYSGVGMGQIFGGKLRPDHSLALFHDLARENVANTLLSLEEALDYLRKREFGNLSRLAEGLNLLTYTDTGISAEGLPIGWTKRIGHRTNTMLPNSFRIVNL